jgi:hypothetical protein
VFPAEKQSERNAILRWLVEMTVVSTVLFVEEREAAVTLAG